jgi:hypothetical protein
MAAVTGDDELHCFRQAKFFSIAELATYIGSVGGVQFIEAIADVPTSNPPITASPAFYLGNVSGTFYVWSIINQAWIGIVTI